MQASPHGVASTSLEHPETNLIRKLPDRDGRSFSPHLSEVFRHTGWWRHRELVYDSMRRTDQGRERMWNFGQCGKHAYVVQNPTEPDQYRVTGSTCHDRFCLPCANSRSHTIALNTLEHLAGRESRFITLTLHSTTESLGELLAKISADFVKLRSRALWKKTQRGGVAFIEVKRILSLDRWNVHMHILSEGRYIRQGKLSQLWLRITGSSPIVDVRFVKDGKQISRYVTKYASKPLHHSVLTDASSLDEAIVAFKGKRLCATFGSWRGVVLTDSPSEAAWNHVDTLSNLISKGLQGDAESIRILNLIGFPGVIVLPQPRPPPTQRQRLCESECLDQTLLPLPYCGMQPLQWA